MRGVTIAVLVVSGIMAGGQDAAAQAAASGKSGPREVLPRAREIALARSAAPRAVSADAGVMVWNGADFELAVPGSNGVTCYVARSWPESIEPHCFDAEGARTILPMHMLQTRLRHEGRTDEEIEAAIARGLHSGALRLPERPVMSYMMSPDQRLISDEGRAVGAWRPHIMIYYPYLTSEALGLGATPSLDAGHVVDPGTPFANLMVVVRDFAAPADSSTSR